LRTRATARSQGLSSLKYTQNNSSRSEALPSSQPLSVTNPLSLLTKLPDPTTRNEATSSKGRTINT